MPSTEDILAWLTNVANQGISAAIAWHVVLLGIVVALFAGWRPKERIARGLIGVSLMSVAMFAFAYANPVTGLVFTASAIGLGMLGATAQPAEVSKASSVGWIAGVLMIGFGWVYPHFLAQPPIAYLMASPFGILPCPTLAVAIGFALLGGGFGSRAWSLALAALGLAFGLFGAARLGVTLDVVLIGGSVVLAATALRGHASSRFASDAR